MAQSVKTEISELSNALPYALCMLYQQPGAGDPKQMTPKSRIAPSYQRVLVFQQNGSGKNKIAGLRKYGEDSVVLESISIGQTLPTVIDNTADYLPENFQADLVLDPIYGKNPVHLAAEIHRKALLRALKYDFKTYSLIGSQI